MAGSTGVPCSRDCCRSPSSAEVIGAPVAGSAAPPQGRDMSLRNWSAALAIAVGVIGLLLDFWVIAGTTVALATNPVARSIPNMLVYYWTFLTNLSNGAIILA